MADSKVAFITGASRGIGRATALALARKGYDVVVTARTLEAGEAFEHGSRDSEVKALPGSLRETADAVEALGGLDGVFVNAGIDGEDKDAMELTVESFRRVLDVNVIGAFVLARAAARAMQRGSAIVINASDSGLRPEHGFADYNTSKAAAITLAQSLALDFAPRGIAVTAICPGYIRTRMTEPMLDDPKRASELLADIPAGRFGEPVEVAELVDFLLSGRATYLTGSVIAIDGARNV
jgi:NAD(P)-dependent dehydrogenase (short-subunit alcohol dehydrogenase family)